MAYQNADWSRLWQAEWESTRARFESWWRGEGLILHVTAPLDEPRWPDVPTFPLHSGESGIDFDVVLDGAECDLACAWTNAKRRARLAEIHMARTYYGGEAFPYFDTQIGPGSLGLMLGVPHHFNRDTVWYEPNISDPATHPPLRLDPLHPMFGTHQAVIEAGLAHSGGRFLVGMPDLIENLDVLAALRGTQAVMFDLVERPDWVKQMLADINTAFFAVFDALFDLIRDPWGGNAFAAFKVWGPGRTAKVQCDAMGMISPAMFAEFVVPPLAQQCAWLDYTVFHLDGTQAVKHLDALLAIDELHAIEWTPQAGRPRGGDPVWYDLYRRILAGGKSVQAIEVEPDEVIPLLDAVGGRGMYIMTEAVTEAEARALEQAVEAYR